MITNHTQFCHAVRGVGYCQVICIKGSRPLLQIMATGQTIKMSYAVLRGLVCDGSLIQGHQSKAAVSYNVIHS